MKRHKNASLLCLVVLLATLLPAVVTAAEPAQYRGTYRISDLAAAEAARDTAVEGLAARIPVLFRAIARMRMKAVATVTLSHCHCSVADEVCRTRRLRKIQQASPRGLLAAGITDRALHAKQVQKP